MKDFAGRVAVITGAGSGIGRALADRAAALGMKLVLADVDPDALERATDELLAGGSEVLSMVCDVRKCSHVEELADAAIIRFHGVHLVFNNAGVTSAGLVWEHSEADWEWVLGVNLWGAIHGVRIFTPLMLDCAKREAGYEGHIVNTAAMTGLFGAPALGPETVSRHAVVALSETLYHDLRLVDAPIGASVLCPDQVPTAIAQSQRHRSEEARRHHAPPPSQPAIQALLAADAAAGGMSAAAVADFTFEAIRDGAFYIVPQPQGLDAVAARAQAIVNVAPPADARAHLTDALHAQLKGQ